MSTSAQLNFCDEGGNVQARLYQCCDGYPHSKGIVRRIESMLHMAAAECRIPEVTATQYTLLYCMWFADRFDRSVLDCHDVFPSVEDDSSADYVYTITAANERSDVTVSWTDLDDTPRSWKLGDPLPEPSDED